MKCFTGVGSRNTPKEVLMLMWHSSLSLMDLDYHLRTGDADGADKAFRRGTVSKKQSVYTAADCTADAMAISKRYHPAWDKCSTFAKKLHGRSAFQVLGHNLKTPSSLLICWTPDGAINHSQRSIKTGGTGTAISIASEHNIPVINLALEEHFERLHEKVFNVAAEKYFKRLYNFVNN